LKNDQYISKVFDLAKKAGFSEWELYFEDNDSIKLQAFEGEIIEYASSNANGVNFRGIYEGQLGSSYSEIIDDQSAETLITHAKEAAEYTEVEDIVFIFNKNETYPDIDLVHPSLMNASIQKKIDMVLRNEKEALATGKLDKIFGTYYSDGYTRKRAVNSHGLDLSYDRNHAFMYMEVIASDNSGNYSATEYKISPDFDELEATPLGTLAVEKVTAKKGGKTIKTGRYPVILENSAAASLLAAHMSIFSADASQKGMSLLKGKVGTSIAAENLSLVDDPLLVGGMASAPFDGEGVPCHYKHIIKDGNLETMLHNLKTAFKEKVETTGNASRGGYKGNIGVSHSNAYILNGSHTVSDLQNTMNSGLYINELDGLHAGTNAITGDFSLGARGFMIDGGKVSRPVNQIVLSGNLFTMLKEIEGIADDLKFYFQPVGSPSLLIRSLSIAGE
jgi:PmbA protein